MSAPSGFTQRLRNAADNVMPGFSREEVEAMGKSYDYQRVEIAYPAAKALADDLISAARIIETLRRELAEQSDGQ